MEPAKGGEEQRCSRAFQAQAIPYPAWRRTWLGQVHRAGRSGADWIIPRRKSCPIHSKNTAVDARIVRSTNLLNKLPLSMEHNSDDVLLIFQAPGCEEWRNRQPLWSRVRRSAAVRICKSLKRIKKSRHDFSITNAVQCYPGKGSTRDKKPDHVAQGQCANWLKKDIESRCWNKIVVFGQIAELSVRCLGYGRNPRFRFVPHPSSTNKKKRLSDKDLDAVLCWALGRNNANG